MVAIAVIGRAECSPAEAAMAEEVGGLLAARSVVVVCGGLSGVMEAACRGAASRGGVTVGILPGNDRRSANPWVSVPIATGVGQARNIAVVRSAQAVIAIGGAYGTLSEIAFALDADIPVVGVNTWRLAEERTASNLVREVSTPLEAVELALKLANEKE
ncbi:MAG: TIGR00725 family protein [Dehalococcoidia bacterium]|nr:MAG: TIGR00725 family protein [Dehalococcoidia bacterium]